ncbi:MAG: hypothetical protein WC651_00130 [Candidatus Gracilibacteria bacterium]|jgi:hypothetical protein
MISKMMKTVEQVGDGRLFAPEGVITSEDLREEKWRGLLMREMGIWQESGVLPGGGICGKVGSVEHYPNLSFEIYPNSCLEGLRAGRRGAAMRVLSGAGGGVVEEKLASEEERQKLDWGCFVVKVVFGNDLKGRAPLVDCVSKLYIWDCASGESSGGVCVTDFAPVVNGVLKYDFPLRLEDCLIRPQKFALEEEFNTEKVLGYIRDGLI